MLASALLATTTAHDAYLVGLATLERLLRELASERVDLGVRLLQQLLQRCRVLLRLRAGLLGKG